MHALNGVLIHTLLLSTTCLVYHFPQRRGAVLGPKPTAGQAKLAPSPNTQYFAYCVVGHVVGHVCASNLGILRATSNYHLGTNFQLSLNLNLNLNPTINLNLTAFF